jgi:hypothetical protein
LAVAIHPHRDPMCMKAKHVCLSLFHFLIAFATCALSLPYFLPMFHIKPEAIIDVYNFTGAIETNSKWSSIFNFASLSFRSDLLFVAARIEMCSLVVKYFFHRYIGRLSSHLSHPFIQHSFFFRFIINRYIAEPTF